MTTTTTTSDFYRSIARIIVTDRSCGLSEESGRAAAARMVDALSVEEHGELFDLLVEACKLPERRDHAGTRAFLESRGCPGFCVTWMDVSYGAASR